MRWSSLFNWCSSSARYPRFAQVNVVLYTRAGCHLCEDVWRFLAQEQQRLGFQLASVDVDASPDLTARYGLQVPVVTVNGKERFRGTINPALWERLLLAEVRRRPFQPEQGPEATP